MLIHVAWAMVSVIFLMVCLRFPGFWYVFYSIIMLVWFVIRMCEERYVSAGLRTLSFMLGVYFHTDPRTAIWVMVLPMLPEMLFTFTWKWKYV